MILRIIIFAVLLFSLACSIKGIRQRPIELKFIVAWIIVTLLSEAAAFYLAVAYRNNLPVFHIFGPILLVVSGLYFTHISPVIKKYKIGWTIAIIGVLASVANSLYLQPIRTFNSNFLLFSGLCICMWGFIVLMEYAKNYDSPLPGRNPDFWITIVLVFQQVGAYFLYILIRLLELVHTTPGNIAIAYYALWSIGVISYLSIGVIFLSFPVKYKT